MSYIENYLSELETTIGSISRSDLQRFVDLLWDVLYDDRQVFIIGNGGSAATASHMMNDLCKLTLVSGQPRFRAIALTDNMPLVTAWGNDDSYDYVFTQPLRNLMNNKDMLVAFSTSGDSPNILSAVRCAHDEFEGVVVGVTGDQGGSLADESDLVIRIPSSHIGHQEDGHLIVNHAVCNALADKLSQL